MKTLTIRGLSRRLAEALEREKRRRHTSLNQTVLDVLSTGLGVEAGDERRNGLARFAGTWSAEAFEEFEAALRSIDQIDEELWR